MKVILLLLLLPGITAAGDTDQIMVLDSLLQREKLVLEDTSRVVLMNKICWEYRVTGDYQKSLKYGEKALVLAIKSKYDVGAALTQNNLGLLYFKADYSAALAWHRKALKGYEEHGIQNGVASALNNIGSVYVALGDYTQALDYNFKSLKIRKSLSDEREIAKSYYNIGVVYSTQGNYPRALSYLQGHNQPAGCY